MEFYSKNKINPMGGCLPTLIQLPLLFALYWTFNGPPFTDKTIDVRVDVVPPAQAQTVKKAEASGTNSIYISKKSIAAKVVIFPGNSTVTAGSDLTFAARAAEGQLPPDFSPHWRMVLPKHEVIEATPVGETKIQGDGNQAWIDSSGHAFFPSLQLVNIMFRRLFRVSPKMTLLLLSLD